MIRGKLKNTVLIFVAVLIISLLPTSYLFASDGPSVKTDKNEYSAEKEVKIKGKDFDPACSYTIIITDRMGSQTSDKIDLKKDGKFEYKYKSNGVGGDYGIKVVESGRGTPIAETSFFERYPTISVKKDEYGTGKKVKIEGENFLPETDFRLEITTKNGVFVNEKITTKKDGKFDYCIELTGIGGEYLATLYNSNNEQVASTSFFEEELTVSTNKDDYAPGTRVKICGRNFTPNESFTIVVICPDGTIVKGDGKFTPGSDVIKSDKHGKFEYKYQLYEVSESFNPEGLYTVKVLNPAGNIAAEITFSDSTVRW